MWLLDAATSAAEARRLAGFGQRLRIAAPDREAVRLGPLNETLRPNEAVSLRWWMPGGGPWWDEVADGPDVVTADHFTTIELLTEPGPLIPEGPLAVRIETAFGHNSFGVNPGRETRDLVEVVLRSERLSWAGLEVAVRSAGMAEAAVSAFEDLGDLVARAASQTTQPNLCYRAADDELCPLLPPGSERVIDAPIVGVRAKVVGRPGLDRAEIGVGRTAGLAPKQKLTTCGGIGPLRVIAVDAMRSLVEWPEPLHDRLIGQTVDLAIDGAAALIGTVPAGWVGNDE